LIQKPLPKPAGWSFGIGCSRAKNLFGWSHNVPAIERLVEFIQEQEEPVTILFQPFGMRTQNVGVVRKTLMFPLF
jgi:hypothetical protein